MEISDPSIGIVSGGQTYATYMCFINTASHGSYIRELVTSTTISAWPASTAVVSGELRSQGFKLWQSNSSRTTRASFDGTEQSNWTEVGNGTGQTKRVAYVDDNTANEYLIEFGSLTGNGYWEYALQQYSYGTPPNKASIKVGYTDAGSMIGIGVAFLRSDVITVENVTQLLKLKNIVHGTPVKTLGYSTGSDGGGQDFIYYVIGRAANSITNNLGLDFHGLGSDDYFSAVERHTILAKRFGCKGDGTTNDTTRLNAAITLATALGQSIRFERGTYVLSTLTHPSRTSQPEKCFF
ncbi:MAG TPA: hypothetical protein VM260_27610 [Pirellula sp.]|nr:hypothetical protein [Pirellula sp.]